MNRIRLLAMSDTHLGEECSVLSFPAGRQELWKVLCETFGTLDRDDPDHVERFEVDELVLLGDIPDRTMSSTSQMVTQVNAFVETLGSAAKVHRCVYIPGNHDHTMWTSYVERERKARAGGTGPSGASIVKEGDRCQTDGCGDEFLTTLFGYPDGSSWRAIRHRVVPHKFDCVVANPVHATVINGRTYVFTHGTHFRPDVCLPRRVKQLLKQTHLDRGLAGLDICPDCEVRGALSLGDLEERVTRFVDTLWPSPGNNPTSRSNQLFYMGEVLRGRPPAPRPAPPHSKLYAHAHLSHVPEERLMRLTGPGRPVHPSLANWARFFYPQMLEHLAEHNLPTKELTFVYGDTHTGGWGEIPRKSGTPIRVYNTGAWTASRGEGHPPCQVFVVDDKGEEAILDVSFANVETGGQNLVWLAGQAAEYKYRGASFLMKQLKPLAQAILGHYMSRI